MAQLVIRLVLGDLQEQAVLRVHVRHVFVHELVQGDQRVLWIVVIRVRDDGRVFGDQVEVAIGDEAGNFENVAALDAGRFEVGPDQEATLGTSSGLNCLFFRNLSAAFRKQ